MNDNRDIVRQVVEREQFERNGGGAAATSMPRYRSHKEVWALKLADVIDPAEPENETDGSRILVPAEPGYAPFRVNHDFVRKHDPRPGGYFVVYADGYKSFSPAQPFEEGYTRL